ncbi:mannobiose 2-epimerase [Pontibacter ummariensis]|uniref:Cellobiose 2-epimerase n=1 Tax=Pontibacter ummariensis TaxID=1610492 RepID=A0A239IES6_9BACT|nr:AGE family epimerase/isomerase [Pontibacter ummariensis]PRY09944.1 mannobiose 2-epimerase [Pontibacter ummariensis]SNS90934.1 mannobiose 2-epimerase [Pontibacter ummariensis]
MTSSEETTLRDTLTAYRAEAATELANIASFWKANALDRQHGGFIGRMDHTGKVHEDAPKGAILNARILWTFSAIYRHTQSDSDRQMADRAYHYLLDHFVDKTYGGVYWSVDAEGKPLSTRKQIYALAFAIYGLSEYFLATQEATALEACQELYHWIETHSFDPAQGGYLEAFSREGVLLEDLRLSEKDRNDPKTMNTHLHVLEAYANLYRIWPDKHLGQQLKALIKVFLERIIDPQTGHMVLFLNENWQPTADLVSYGHDIEASWLLQEAAEVLGDKELLHQVEKVAVQMAESSKEGLQPDGSLYHELDRQAQHYDKHREWWVSAEAMVGFLNAYQLTGQESFLHDSIKAWQFAKTYLLDRQQGEWFWGVHNDYSLMQAEDKIGFWKCPYHNARACLEVINRCEALFTSTVQPK